MSQLSGQDAGFLYIENDTVKTHFTLMMIYDQSGLAEPLRYRDILRYFEERMPGLPVFRCKLHRVPLELDAPYFVDDPNFHIESHVRHIALPKPGDWRQFCILAAQIQAVPMDFSKPLWDMHVIEGLDDIEGIAPGSFAILTRLHHAIADGTTARGLLMALHHPAGKPPPVLKRVAAERAPSLLEMGARAVLNNTRQAIGLQQRALRLLPGVGPALARAAGNAIGKALDRAELSTEDAALQEHAVTETIFNGEMEYRRIFQLRRYPLAEIKRMRELAPGSTLNDVVLTLVGGGLRRYLAARGEQCDQDLIAICPINLREDKLGNDSRLGNNISLMQVNLHTRSARPAQRLAGVLAATTAAKLQQKASTAKELIALSMNAPNLLLAAGTQLAARAAFRHGSNMRLSNCIITNVPGPQEPLYFMGARLELFTGVAPISPGSGVTLAVSSYCGQLCISFTGCPAWIEDPQQFAECLTDSFAEMLAATDRLETARKPGRRVTRKGSARPKKPVVKSRRRP